MYQMIEITINKNKGVWSGGNVPAFYVLDYDEDTQTATCRADIMDLGEEEFPLEGLNVLQEECAYAPLDLDESQFTQETLPIELYYDNNHSFGEVDIVEIDKALTPAREENGLLYTGMGLSLDSYLDENGDPVVLKPGELQELPMTDPADLSLSAVGFIDDQLTIQLKSGWQMPGTDVEVVCVPAGQGRKISRQIQRDTNSGQLGWRSVDALLLVGNQRNTNLGFALGESGDVKDKVVLGGDGYWETRGHQLLRFCRDRGHEGGLDCCHPTGRGGCRPSARKVRGHRQGAQPGAGLRGESCSLPVPGERRLRQRPPERKHRQ